MFTREQEAGKLLRTPLLKTPLSQIRLVAEDILGNLRVRISDLWWKNTPKKDLKFNFCLKHQKLTTPKRIRLQVSLSSSQFALLLPKNPLYFQNYPFISHNCTYTAWKLHFISWNYSFVSFVFHKCPVVFQNCPLVFQKCLSI